MLIWIPVDGSGDEKQSKVAKLFELEQWGLVDFDAGEVKSTRFFKKREEFTEWVDFIILANKYESYIDFMNEGMMVLCVREEETIEEIIEAYKFKELDEMGF
jgi:predicted Fe-Mo cluster-binding NifX family protein